MFRRAIGRASFGIASIQQAGIDLLQRGKQLVRPRRNEGSVAELFLKEIARVPGKDSHRSVAQERSRPSGRLRAEELDGADALLGRRRPVDRQQSHRAEPARHRRGTPQLDLRGKRLRQQDQGSAAKLRDFVRTDESRPLRLVPGCPHAHWTMFDSAAR